MIRDGLFRSHYLSTMTFHLFYTVDSQIHKRTNPLSRVHEGVACRGVACVSGIVQLHAEFQRKFPPSASIVERARAHSFKKKAP